jgi:hypothetical protein
MVRARSLRNKGLQRRMVPSCATSTRGFWERAKKLEEPAGSRRRMNAIALKILPRPYSRMTALFWRRALRRLNRQQLEGAA